jgi:hypothetical protein
MSSTSKKKNSNALVAFDISVYVLDQIVTYCLTTNTIVTRKSLLKVRELLQSLDPSTYESDRSKEVRVKIAEKLLEAKLDEGLKQLPMIWERIQGGEYDNEMHDVLSEIDADNGFQLSNEEVLFVENWISDRLQFSKIYAHKDGMNEIFLKLTTGDFSSMKDLGQQAFTAITALYSDMRDAMASDKYASRDFSTEPESLMNALTQVHAERNAPSNRVRTGIQWLNKMLGGGFQSGRVYMFLAISGGWKSGLLVNVAQWVAKYNKDLAPKDPTKKPVALYLTLENDIPETVERFHSYHSGVDIEFKDMLPKDAAEAMNQGLRQEEYGPEIVVAYRPNRSINVAGIDSICADLEVEGKEVVIVILDYVKRIRSNEGYDDLRIELGEVVNNLSVLAKDRGIPIVTASQLNRDAFKVIEAAVSKKKADMSKTLGMSHIGESALMIENLDAAFIINREELPNCETKYLTIKQVKHRGKESPITYFAHPFENSMKMVEDFEMKESASKRELADGLAEFQGGSTSGKDGQPRGKTMGGKGALPARKPTTVSGTMPAPRPRASVVDAVTGTEEVDVA